MTAPFQIIKVVTMYRTTRNVSLISGHFITKRSPDIVSERPKSFQTPNTSIGAMPISQKESKALVKPRPYSAKYQLSARAT